MTSLKILEKSLTDHFSYHIERNECRYIVSYCKRLGFRELADNKLQDVFHELNNTFNEWMAGLVRTGMDVEVFEFREVEQVILDLHACFEGAINMMLADKR